jgi:hypothetical protein
MQLLLFNFAPSSMTVPLIQFVVAENISPFPISEFRVMKVFWRLFGGINLSLSGVWTVRGSFRHFPQSLQII